MDRILQVSFLLFPLNFGVLHEWVPIYYHSIKISKIGTCNAYHIAHCTLSGTFYSITLGHGQIIMSLISYGIQFFSVCHIRRHFHVTVAEKNNSLRNNPATLSNMYVIIYQDPTLSRVRWSSLSKRVPGISNHSAMNMQHLWTADKIRFFICSQINSMLGPSKRIFKTVFHLSWVSFATYSRC